MRKGKKRREFFFLTFDKVHIYSVAQRSHINIVSEYGFRIY
jgi:hypothetical protein